MNLSGLFLTARDNDCTDLLCNNLNGGVVTDRSCDSRVTPPSLSVAKSCRDIPWHDCTDLDRSSLDGADMTPSRLSVTGDFTDLLRNNLNGGVVTDASCDSCVTPSCLFVSASDNDFTDLLRCNLDGAVMTASRLSVTANCIDLLRNNLNGGVVTDASCVTPSCLFVAAGDNDFTDLLRSNLDGADMTACRSFVTVDCTDVLRSSLNGGVVTDTSRENPPVREKL